LTSIRWAVNNLPKLYDNIWH